MTTSGCTDPADAYDLEALAREYWERGFIHLPGAVSVAEISALREETLAQVEAGIREPPSDFGRALTAEGVSVQYRVDGVMKRALSNESVLLATVHPVILAMTSQLFGEASYGTDALVFKGDQGGAVVPMHSAFGMDGIPKTPWELERDICNVAIHLDPSTPETGCLLFLPGAHRLPPEEVVSLTTSGFDLDGLVSLPTEAGDITLHSEYVIHGSRPTPPDRPLRRVLYFSFAAASRHLAESDRGTAMRMRLREVAAERRRFAPYASDEPLTYEVPPRWRDAVASVDRDALDEELGSILEVSKRMNDK